MSGTTELTRAFVTRDSTPIVFEGSETCAVIAWRMWRASSGFEGE